MHCKKKKSYGKGGKLYGKGGLTPKQKKLDKNNDGQISGEDFKMMNVGGLIKRAERNVAKASKAAEGMQSEKLSKAKKSFRKAVKKSAKAAKLYNKARSKAGVTEGSDVTTSSVMKKAVYKR